MDEKELCEAFEIHNRINLYLLDAIEQAHLKDVSASKGRNAGEQFAHIHNVRLMWLKASAPGLLEGLEKVEKDAALDKKKLAKALRDSGRAMTELLKRGVATGKIKSFKPGVLAFFGYIVSHESHHRGQILLCLKQSGYRINQKVQYGIWEWGVR